MPGDETSRISGTYQDLVTTQHYGQTSKIDGVSRIDLRSFSDEGGDFCEIVRLSQDGTVQDLEWFRPAQISYSRMEPGAIKAWHLHRNQDDLWFVSPHDRVLVGLLDVREDSPTRGESMRFALGTGRASLLLIPRGVAHGVANLGRETAVLTYLVNQRFDAQAPDEHRLPYDVLGPDFWTIRPG